MSEAFVHRDSPRFIFYANYKVMFSTLCATLPRYFPSVERNAHRPVDGIGQYLKLGIVRNPYARFVSLYVDKCVSDPKAKLKLSEGVFLQPVQGQLIEELARLRGQSMSIARTWQDLTNDLEERELCRDNFRTLQTISFEEFTTIAQRILKRADADPHFNPQSQHYFSGGRCVLDYVFRLERIDHDWWRICELLGMAMELGRENSTIHGPYQEYYQTAGTATAVYRLYKLDFGRFSYSRDLR